MMSQRQQAPPAVFIMGPTASGKTSLAVALHQSLPIELISVDSAMVFKGMNIGTAKPDREVLAQAPHHLMDIRHPTAPYSAADFRQDALTLMADITARGKVPVLVGGSMLYFRALSEGLSQLPAADPSVRAGMDAEAAQVGWPAMHARLADIDPTTAERLQPNDSQRIQRALEVYRITGKTMTQLHAESSSAELPYRVLKLALIPSQRQVLHERIAVRFSQMLADGLIDEVRQLRRDYPSLTGDATAMRCVGYRQTWEHLQGVYDQAALCNRGIYATRQLAKRQLTWLRGMSDTCEVDCLDVALYEIVLNLIKQHINN